MEVIDRKKQLNATLLTPTIAFPNVYAELVLGAGVYALLLSLIGILMNAIIIYIAIKILFKIPKRKTQHLCILSMAVADLMFASVHCPITFLEFTFARYPDFNTCTFALYVANLSTVASSISLLFLNIDKFLMLRYTLSYPTIVNWRRGGASMILCWTISLSWATFFVFGPFNALRDQCQRGFYEFDSYHAYFSFVILAFILPITVSLVISIYIYVIAKRAARPEYNLVVLDEQGRRSPSSRRSRQQQGRCQSSEKSFDPIEKTRVAKLRKLEKCDSSDSTSYSERMIPSTPENHGTRETQSIRRFKANQPKKELKTAVFVFSTTVWSFSTSIPYRMFTLVFYNDREKWDQWMMIFQLFAYVLIMSNPTGNPFVTCLVQPQYRAKFRELTSGLTVRFRWKRGKQQPTPSANLAAI